MKAKKITALILALIMLLSLCACGSQSAALAAAEAPAAEAPAESELPAAEPEEITITDMIGREVTVTPGSYKRVVCIGAGALRMYSYIGDVSLLCGVEDIDNTTLDERPKMFDSVARPMFLLSATPSALCPHAASVVLMHRLRKPKKYSPATRISLSPSTRMSTRRTHFRSSSACLWSRSRPDPTACLTTHSKTR